MHLFLLAVRSDYLNRGLGYELCKRTMELAIEKGMREVLVEATSPGTAWICEKYLGCPLEHAESLEEYI